MQNEDLTTPIYMKTSLETPWPSDPVFYLLTSDGLFLCRNHDFFRSCVPARRFPRELAWQDTKLSVSYPQISQRQLQQVVAFFIHVGERYSAEAIVLLAWDETRDRVRIVVPDQVATVGQNSWNEMWPIGVEYEPPRNLPTGWILYGDCHSHVDGPAYASNVDRHDEAYQPGLHLVIGRVFDDVPDMFAQAVVDGARFNLSQSHVIAGYEKAARRFPRGWMDKVSIQLPGRKPEPVVSPKPVADDRQDESAKGDLPQQDDPHPHQQDQADQRGNDPTNSSVDCEENPS